MTGPYRSGVTATHPQPYTPPLESGVPTQRDLDWLREGSRPLEPGVPTQRDIDWLREGTRAPGDEWQGFNNLSARHSLENRNQAVQSAMDGQAALENAQGQLDRMSAGTGEFAGSMALPMNREMAAAARAEENYRARTPEEMSPIQSVSGGPGRYAHGTATGDADRMVRSRSNYDMFAGLMESDLDRASVSGGVMGGAPGTAVSQLSRCLHTQA